MQHIDVAKLGTVPFLQLVATMRHWQRHYFKTRDRGALIESKVMEQEVDRRIARETGPRAEPTLFDRMKGGE